MKGSLAALVCRTPNASPAPSKPSAPTPLTFRPMPRSVAPESPIRSSSNRTLSLIADPTHQGRIAEDGWLKMDRATDAARLAAVTMASDPRESSREEETSMSHRAILLPGIVLPAELAYPALIEALGEGVEARAKELEVYASDQPGPDYGIETELAGILREAEVAGFERFHLVGYSGGGAISAAFAARTPDRLLSLSLLEPAWVGNEGRSERELRVQAEFDRTRG